MRPSHWIVSRAADRIIAVLALVAAAVLITPIVLLAVLPFMG